MEIIKYIAFGVLLIYFTNWVLILAFLRSLLTERLPVEEWKNRKYLSKLKQKTGLDFKIKVVGSDWMFGAMPGLPFKPVMIISRRAVKELSLDELEWLILHEAGHCVMWHVAKQVMIFLILLGTGILLIHDFNLSIWLESVLAILLAIIFYQLASGNEYQADYFAVTKMDKPKSMITANEKFKLAGRSRIYKNDILRTLFTPHPSYEFRKQMATREIQSRINSRTIRL